MCVCVSAGGTLLVSTYQKSTEDSDEDHSYAGQCVCVCVCVGGGGVRIHVCVCVEQLAIDVYSLPTGEREALVSLAKQRGCRAKGGVGKSQGML